MDRKQEPIKVEDLKTIKEVHELLKSGFSPRNIYRKISSGELQEGIHWLNQGTPHRRMIRIILPALLEYLRTPTIKRDCEEKV